MENTCRHIGYRNQYRIYSSQPLEEKLLVQEQDATTKSSEATEAFIEQPENKSAAAENEPALESRDGDQATANKDFENDIYNQRILPNEDSAAFKTYFEKAYPGYIRRLRASFYGLTEAEERLFLFIKLNLKSKEFAAILGIFIDSVKKHATGCAKGLY